MKQKARRAPKRVCARLARRAAPRGPLNSFVRSDFVLPPYRPKTVAAVLYALLALMVAGVWVIYLWVDNPKGVSAVDNFSYALLDAPGRRFFYALAVIPLISASLCGGYGWGIANSKRGSLLLLIISIVQGAAAVLLLPWPQSGLFLVPLYWCFKSLNRT